MFYNLLGPCVLPYAVVHHAQKMTDALKAAQKVKEIFEKNLPELLNRNPQTLMGAGIATSPLQNSPGIKFFSNGVASWAQGVMDDMGEFAQMVKDSNGSALLDFFKFLGTNEYFPILLFSPSATMWMGAGFIIDRASRVFEEAVNPTSLFPCMGSLATFAVYPNIPNCEIPTPRMDITTEDLKDFAKDAAIAIVPGLAFVL